MMTTARQPLQRICTDLVRLLFHADAAGHHLLAAHLSCALHQAEEQLDQAACPDGQDNVMLDSSRHHLHQ